MIRYCILFAVMCFASQAVAQVQVGPPVKVPVSACPSNCIPIDVDPDCDAGALTCTRTDYGPYYQSAGTPTTLRQRIECTNCFPECPCCPVLHGLHDGTEGDCLDCSGVPSAICMFTIHLTHTESATVSLSSTLTATAGVPAVAAIEAALESTLGITTTTTYSFGQQCGWTPLAACEDGVWKNAEMSYTAGVVVAMDHTWSASGVWVSVGGGTCPIAGNPWNTTCLTETSTASGDPYSNHHCGNPSFFIPCPPES